MKATSIRLEGIVEISPKELELLKFFSLNGLWRYIEWDKYGPNMHLTKDVPFNLRYENNPGIESLSVEWTPEVYFSDASKLLIVMYDFHYQNLIEFGIASDRFGLGGKVIIEVK